MITSITIKPDFERYERNNLFARLRGFPLPAFPVDYTLRTDSNLVFLVGRMGSGKTTLLEKMVAQGQVYAGNYLAIVSSGSSEIDYLFTAESAFPPCGCWYSQGIDSSRRSSGEVAIERLSRFLGRNGKVLLLDLPEANIPHIMIDNVADMVRQASRRNQLFVATHEPRLISIGGLVLDLDRTPAEALSSSDYLNAPGQPFRTFP